MQRGKIAKVGLEIVNQSLRAYLTVQDEEGLVIEAALPQREIAALLPRSVFLGEANSVPVSLLADLQITIEKLLLNRMVELWEYREKMYCGFEKWRNIAAQVGEPATVE